MFHWGSYIGLLDLYNKLKIYNYLILIFKCIAKKTTGQWTYIHGSASQRINAQSYQDCMKIKSSVLSSKVEFNQNALTIQPRRHASIQNNEKCIGGWSNIATSGMKIINKYKNSSIDFISTAQVRWNTKQFF